ncbi:MAG: hypothetical protein V8T12_06485 [Parabacteroides johnsonii]
MDVMLVALFGANNGVIVGCVSCGEVKADFSGGIAGESFGPIKASYFKL